MAMYAKVRRLRLRDGLTISEIARRTSLSRNPSQGHEMLFDAHMRCLTGLGGVASRGIYDNMKTAVDRTPRKDRGRVVNARFAAVAALYLFEPDFCNVASGWEKGRVEKGVQDARRRIWQAAQHARVASFADLNVWLATQCVAAWDAPHPELAGVAIREAWLQERAQLMPMPTPFDSYVELPARVSSTSLITMARSRYSVPCAWAGHRVSVRLYPERVVVVADQQVVNGHPIIPRRGHRNLPTPATVGDQSGSVVPSKTVFDLSRPALTVTTVPLAAPDRYDSLRTQEVSRG